MVMNRAPFVDGIFSAHDLRDATREGAPVIVHAFVDAASFDVTNALREIRECRLADVVDADIDDPRCRVR